MVITASSTQFQFDSKVILCSDIGSMNSDDDNVYIYPVFKEPTSGFSRKPLFVVRKSGVKTLNGDTVTPDTIASTLWKIKTTPVVTPVITTTTPVNPSVGDIVITGDLLGLLTQ